MLVWGFGAQVRLRSLTKINVLVPKDGYSERLWQTVICKEVVVQVGSVHLVLLTHLKSTFRSRIWKTQGQYMNCFTVVNLSPLETTTSLTEMETQINLFSDYKLFSHRKGRNHISVIGQKHFSLLTYSIKHIACEVRFASGGTLHSPRKNLQLFKKTPLFIYGFPQSTNFSSNVKFSCVSYCISLISCLY